MVMSMWWHNWPLLEWTFISRMPLFWLSQSINHVLYCKDFEYNKRGLDGFVQWEAKIGHVQLLANSTHVLLVKCGGIVGNSNSSNQYPCTFEPNPRVRYIPHVTRLQLAYIMQSQFKASTLHATAHRRVYLHNKRTWCKVEAPNYLSGPQDIPIDLRSTVAMWSDSSCRDYIRQ